MSGGLAAQPKPARLAAGVYEAVGDAKYGGLRAWGNKRADFCCPRVCGLRVHGKLHLRFDGGHYYSGVDNSRTKPAPMNCSTQDH